jgi:hypothetical protein
MGGPMVFDNDARCAEELLHELALDLRHVPVDGQTQALHVRALQIKRDVIRWADQSLAAEERTRVLDELSELRAVARRAVGPLARCRGQTGRRFHVG